MMIWRGFESGLGVGDGVEKNGERAAKIFARYASASLPSLQTLASKSGTVALLVDQREVRRLERSGWCLDEDFRKINT
jgi:hypothetical protein